VTLNNAFYNKYFNELLELKNKSKIKIKNTIKRKKYIKTNQEEEVNKVLDKIMKSKKVGNKRIPEIYKIRKEKNRNTIKLYSYINNYKDKLEDEHLNEILEEENITISNKSKFDKYCKILDKIYNNKLIYESDFLFQPGTFSDINKEGIDLLINKLEILCKENDNDILNFKDICNEITKKVEELDIKENKDDIDNNILYKCKNAKCDDDEVENEDDYCNYCKKDLKNCKLCNIEFVNDELDVKYCEDCSESIEMEGAYSDYNDI
jgi:hypothetical protein